LSLSLSSRGTFISGTTSPPWSDGGGISNDLCSTNDVDDDDDDDDDDDKAQPPSNRSIQVVAIVVVVAVVAFAHGRGRSSDLGFLGDVAPWPESSSMMAKW